MGWEHPTLSNSGTRNKNLASDIMQRSRNCHTHNIFMLQAIIPQKQSADVQPDVN